MSMARKGQHIDGNIQFRLGCGDSGVRLNLLKDDCYRVGPHPCEALGKLAHRFSEPPLADILGELIHWKMTNIIEETTASLEVA